MTQGANTTTPDGLSEPPTTSATRASHATNPPTGSTLTYSSREVATVYSAIGSNDPINTEVTTKEPPTGSTLTYSSHEVATIYSTIGNNDPINTEVTTTESPTGATLPYYSREYPSVYPTSKANDPSYSEVVTKDPPTDTEEPIASCDVISCDDTLQRVRTATGSSSHVTFTESTPTISPERNVNHFESTTRTPSTVVGSLGDKFRQSEVLLHQLASLPADAKQEVGYDVHELILDCQFSGVTCFSG